MSKEKTILICNQKGGVGKTLVADELAFGFDRDGIPYNLYDLDQQGGSVHKEVRNDNAVVGIVDTPGALQVITMQEGKPVTLSDLMKDADLIIIPTKMTPRDLQPFLTMIDLIKQNKIKAPVFYVFNEWNRYRATAEFEEWFKEAFPISIYYRIPKSEGFTQAALEGKSILEHREYKSSFAAMQIRELVSAVEYLLGLKETEDK